MPGVGPDGVGVGGGADPDGDDEGGADEAAAALSKQLDEALTAKSNLTQELDSLRARCDGLEKKAEETEWKLKSAVVNMEAAEAKNQHLDSELENAQRQDMQNRSRFDGP